MISYGEIIDSSRFFLRPFKETSGTLIERGLKISELAKFVIETSVLS